MNENMGGESVEVDSSVFRTIGIIARWVIGFTLLFIFVAFARWGDAAALGAMVGGGLASIEWGLSAYIGRRISKSSGRTRTLWTLSFVVKSFVTFGCAGLALFYLDPRGLALGFGALFMGAILGALETQVRVSRAEQ
jgi:hypothetical protein